MKDLDIFLNAPEDASPEELGAYLDDACGGDSALRARVEALFASDKATRGLVDQPPLGAGDGWEKPGERIGPYKLLQKIGEGGFGVVYMADQTQPVRRRVALKIIKQGMDTRQVIARFEAERQALAMMEHPNIAKVLDAGATETGRPYFVMELVRGTPITTFCDAESLDTHQRLALFQDVCSAVGHAHQKGIIHRDLKPSNILVGLDGDTPIVKVIDFGVAKATQLQLTDKTLFTRFEQFIGTPLYISPEQASLSPIDIDTRSDIYSLGVLLYELLTGKPPIDSEELLNAGFDEMRRLIREQEPPKPSTRLSTATEDEQRTIAKARHTEPRKLGLFIKGDLDWIVLKALEKDRKRRYDTAAALRKDIEHFLNDEVVTATPPSALYKFQKFARRNKGALVAGAAVGLALVAGTIASTAQWFRAEDAAKQAESEAAAAEKARGAEKAQRALAEQRLRESARSDRVTAKDLVANGREQEAMAYLARSSRNDPEATEAFDASLELLRNWNHPVGVASLDDPLVMSGGPNVLAWSPDGNTVAGFGMRKGDTRSTGRLWDASSGRVILSFTPEREDEEVVAASFEPDGNCLFLVWQASGPSQALRIWDGSTRSYRLALSGVTGLYPWPVAFSADGSRVLAAEATQELNPTNQNRYAVSTKTIAVWDTKTGQLLGKLGHSGEPIEADFSADGSRVMSWDRGGTGYLWNAESGELLHSMEEVDLHCFSKDGTLFVQDNEVRRVEGNVAVAQLENSVQPAHEPASPGGMKTTGPVGFLTGPDGALRTFSNIPRRSVQFSPDGTLFAGSKLWDVESGRLLRQLSEDSDAECLFSPDGLQIVATQGGKTKAWDTLTGALLASMAGTHPRFSPDGSLLLTRGKAGVRIWRWNTRGLDRNLPQGRYAVTPGGKLISVVGGNLRVSSVEEGTELASWRTSSPVREIYWDSISADETLLATAHWDRTVQVRNIETKTLIHRWDVDRILKGSTATTVPLFSPDGTTLAVWFNLVSSRGPDGKVIGREDTLFFVLESGELRGELRAVIEPSFSPDGTRLVVEAERGRVAVYATETLELLEEYPLPGNQRCRKLGFRPDGSGPLMLTYEGDILDLEAGNSAVSAPPGGAASSFSFSPDGEKMAAHFSRGEQVRVYDVASGQDLGMEPKADWEVRGGSAWHFVKEGGSHLRLRPKSPPVVLRWWGDFLEVVSQMHFNDLGEITSLPLDTAAAMRSDLLALLGKEDSQVAEVARWWLAPPDQKGAYVGSSLTAAEFVDQLIQPGATKEELAHAYRLDPAHPLIHLALATTVESDERARFLADYSRQRLPDDPRLRQRAREFEQQLDEHLTRLAAKSAVESGMDLRSEEAQQIFGRLGKLQLSDPTDSLDLFRTAVVLALGESTDRYEHHCREFARVHGAADDPIVRKRIRLAAMLRPTPATTAIWQELPSLRGEQGAPVWAGRWFDLTEALGSLRSKDGKQALEFLKRDPDPIPDALSANGTLPILFTLLQAMAHQKLGNAEDAQRLLADVRAAMPAMLDRNPIQPGTQFQDRLLCELFLQEAEALIGPAE